MTDLNKLRSEFEELPEVKQWIDRLVYGDNSEVYIPIEETEESNAIATWINGAWFVWKLKAKAQTTPDGYVLIKKEDIENWYLDESEYMWFEADGIDGYLEDIDIGEVVEVQRKEYVVTNSNPVFAAKPWDDKRYCADTWEFFESKDEAEKAAAHCKAMFEASESGAEG